MTLSKKVMILYTDTNGLHQTNKPVTKKYIFDLARLVSLKYSIGRFNYKENGEIDKYSEEKKEKFIFKPKCITFDEKAIDIHGITFEKATKKGLDNYKIMKQFQMDLKGVEIIIGCNLSFHLRAIQVELFRTCTVVEFGKYTLVDISRFNHKDEYISLQKLSEKYNITSDSKLKLIKKLFPPIYNHSLSYTGES